MTYPNPVYSWPMLALDTETTGVDSFNDRIVTCSMIYDDGQGNQVERDWLINPGIEIPTGASDVHGITTEKARAEGVSPQQALLEMANSLIPMIDAGVPLCVYNAPFDLTLLHAEFDRFSIPFGREFNRVIDPFVIDKALDPYRRGKRILMKTAEHYGYTLTAEAAHAADEDNKASIHIARSTIKLAFTDDTSIEEIHQTQIGWKADQSASLQDYFRRTKDPHTVIDGGWPLRSRQEEPAF